MNLFKLTNEIENIKNKMDWILKEDNGYEIEIFPQTWSNSSGAQEDVGADVLTEQISYVIYSLDLKNAYVFFDGVFAYKTEINNNFMKDLNAKSIAGKKSYWERYDMEIYKDNLQEYPYYKETK